MTPHQLNDILSRTLDTRLQRTARELGMRMTASELNNQLTVRLDSPIPTHFLQETLVTPLQKNLQDAFPNQPITAEIVQAIRPHRTQLPGQNLRGVKNVIAIGSGKGGVGKSTVAVNLAITLARGGARVGLLDADIYGPSIPTMLGPVAPIETIDDGYRPVQAHGIEAMSIGYLTEHEGALIWRGPMLAKSLMQLINLTHWDNLDYLFIDLPPGTGDIQLSLVQKIPLAGAIVVTTPQQIATNDASKALHMFEKTNIPILGLIENMAIHTCSSCGHQEELFGTGGADRLAKQFGVQCLAQLPLHQDIMSACDQGQPTACHSNSRLAEQFVNAALNMAVTLAARPLNYQDRLPPILFQHAESLSFRATEHR